jgi:hypothetical protein
MHEWRAQLSTATRDARNLLTELSSAGIGAARLAELRRHGDDTARRLDALVGGAPDEAAGSRPSAAADSLRLYLIAVEAEQLLRDSGATPDADELERASATRRERSAALDAALSDLDRMRDPSGA